MTDNASRERLAIVGLACRFPGGLDNPDLFWEGLVNKYDAITKIPEDRWNIARFYAADDQASGKMYIRKGGFLKQDLRTFDATFFGISPREAAYLDPQQRLLLEVAWEAMENAGIDAHAYAGREVGVYVGGFTLDHMLNQLGAGNRANIGPHSAGGSTMTMLSNRLSHAFDFRGPSMSVDTACSSSLVAFHYGCQDVWNGRCEMVLIGGVNTMIRPEYPIAMCKGRFLAPDGHCKSFDSRANGYARGEGAGVVIVKPLTKALADGDTIWALVEATGVNQDGRTSGITVPNGEAQMALMRRVAREANIDPRRVHYVEAHGTGTKVGDPTEAKAIGSVYGQDRTDNPCVIGSVKSNIGHLEAAAGVAGLIKAVLSLRNNRIPPLATLENPNPDIPFAELGLQLADRLMHMTENGDDAYVAVNSFGYGGTNAHVILQRAPHAKAAAEGEKVAPPIKLRAFPYILPISARSQEGLGDLAHRYRDRFAANDAALDDLLYSVARRREHASQRLAIVAETRNELIERLSDFVDGKPNAFVRTGTQSYQGACRPVFVYTGMGPQWWAMGQELWREEPIYRDTVAIADRIFCDISGFSIIEEMLKGEADSRITETQFAQPANFMVQLGLTAVLRAAGITPGAIVGHSVGEVIASHASGVLSLEDALKVSFHRSRLQKKAAGTGGMLAAALSVSEALRLIEWREHLVSIAAINGPSTITFSGDEAELTRIAAHLEDQSLFNRMLQVEVPYHSPMMEPLKAELVESLAGLRPRHPEISIYSTVTGKRVEDTAYDTHYWTRNVREPVYFADAINGLLADGFTTFIEVGPHPVLSAALKECFSAARSDARSIETLRRQEPERSRVYQAVAQTYACGCEIDWSRHYPEGRFVPLPNYPWQREVLWHEGTGVNRDRTAKPIAPLLCLRTSGVAHLWETELASGMLSYMSDHVIDGISILPAAAYIETVLEAAIAVFPESAAVALRNMSIDRALPLDPERSLKLITSYSPEIKRVVVSSVDANNSDEATQHATAHVYPVAATDANEVDLGAFARSFTHETDVSELYSKFMVRGLQYGPFFKTIQELRIHPDGSEMLVRLALAPDLDEQAANYHSHPALLDGCFQALIALLDGGEGETAYLPTAVKELRLYQAVPSTVWCHGTLTHRSEREVVCDLELIAGSGTVIATIKELRCTALGAAGERLSVPSGNYRYQWLPADEELPAIRLGRWLIVTDGHHGVAERTTDIMRSMGAEVVTAASFSTRHSQDDDIMALRPGDVADAEKLLCQVGELAGVAFFRGLDALPHSDDPTGEQAVASLMAILQALAQRTYARPPRVYVVTQGAFAVTDTDRTVIPSQGTLVGFTRVAFNELEGLRCSTVDLGTLVTDEVLEALAREVLADAPVDEVALRTAGRFISELQNSDTLHETRHINLHLSENPFLAIEPDPQNRAPAVRELNQTSLLPTEVEIHLEAATLPATALRNRTDTDGRKHRLMEIVGTVTAVGAEVQDLTVGARVCGYAPMRLTSHARDDRSAFLVSEARTGVSSETLAAGLMLHAGTAHLANLAGISKTDRVLVWTDAPGLAMIQSALRHGASVTLFGDAAAANGDHEIVGLPCYQRSCDGLDRAVVEQTSGVGFTVIVAPLSQWAKAFDYAALSDGGRVVDMDEVASPVILDGRVGAIYRRDPIIVAAQHPRAILRQARVALTLMGKGEVKTTQPLIVNVADLSDMDMTTLESSERIVLTFEDKGQTVRAIALDRAPVHADATYLITGGFGGLGRALARWLVDQGARNLVLIGRRGADDKDKRAFVAELEGRDVAVLAAACDVADADELATLYATIVDTLPPLKGVIHTAAVLDDRPILEMDRQSLAKVMAAKASGAWALHCLTEKMPLDLFVLFSSISSLVGNSRQANYVAANAFLDALAWHRRLRGLPGTSMNLGAVSDAGIVTRDDRLEQHLKSIGLTAFPVEEALAGLERALARDVPQIGMSRPADWAQWAHYETLGSQSPRFRKLITAAMGEQDGSALARLKMQLQEIEPVNRQEILAALLSCIFAQELHLPEDAVVLDRPVTTFGVDSLMAIDIQMAIEIVMGFKVSALELIGDNTLLDLAAKLLASIGLDVEVILSAAE